MASMWNPACRCCAKPLPAAVSPVPKPCRTTLPSSAAIGANSTGILCDVPCSGLGVIAKKPDIRYKDLDGIENLLLSQQKILQNGADLLAENGRLVYSTCTVNRDENEEQVKTFLENNPRFHVAVPALQLPGMQQGEYGTLFLPHKNGH